MDIKGKGLLLGFIYFLFRMIIIIKKTFAITSNNSLFGNRYIIIQNLECN